ncbi:hypothetical protein KM043_003054 [Ampulex compressa]|nr:hypothetical protein KM043_003054 [Ampulex compressa]
MRTSSLLLLLSCILRCLTTVLGTCTLGKYNGGYGQRVQCFNVSLETALDRSASALGAIVVFQSQLRHVPGRAFGKYANSLESLSLQDCSIASIDRDAFRALTHLQKLGLQYNNLTAVREEWFEDLVSLEQLDLSFNRITDIGPKAFEKLRLLKRLDLNSNRLRCLEPSVLRPVAALRKFQFSENPLSLTCRGKLSLWLRDRGMAYKRRERGEQSWLDSVLWLCAMNDPSVADTEILMAECVILNLFDQLRTALISADSHPSAQVSRECLTSRNLLTNCITSSGHATTTGYSNGSTIRRLLLQLREAVSS